MRKAEDLVGRQFGNLEVMHRAENKHDRVMWECKCSCGNIHITYAKTLKSGRTRSCGCFHKELSTIRATTHGMRRTKEYNVWSGMKARCNIKSATGYANYGGSGITYEPSWELFENFFRDMGKCPDGYSLDRIDNKKGYSKDNCRWATRLQQATNQKRSIYIAGKTLKEFAKDRGMPYNTAYGWYKKDMFNNVFGEYINDELSKSPESTTQPSL